MEASIADIVRDRARLVYQIAYSVSRNHHDAEDASQEVFLRVWRYREKLAEVDDVKAWVARIGSKPGTWLESNCLRWPITACACRRIRDKAVFAVRTGG